MPLEKMLEMLYLILTKVIEYTIFLKEGFLSSLNSLVRVILSDKFDQHMLSVDQ